MAQLDLSGVWRMTGGGYDCEGRVPGSVYSFLLDAGLLDDPFYRANEEQALRLMAHDYTFTRRFSFAPSDKRTLLCCDGLDTLCRITLNGVEVARTQNMHRRYEFDVTALLQSGENEIALTFASPTAYCAARDGELHLPAIKYAWRGHPYLRKAHSMFGWDWGPILPDAGIWRGVYLRTEDGARITDCRIVQRHESGRVFLTVTAATSIPCSLEATLTAPDGKTETVPVGEEFEIENPALWWPSGLGEQPLYTVTVRADGDTVSKRIGLRTLRLVREPDEWGESFCHEVNGVRFFAMGADYIPEDSILARVTEARTRKLLTDSKNANFNTIRVWGGGYYPDDFFFDLCNELGLVVFLDLMTACCLLPDEEEMRAELSAEVRDNLLRVRHHACIGLISGNNEVESMYEKKIEGRAKENYLEVYEGIFPRLISELCPEIAYIPSSPTSHGGFVDPTNENVGDSHYWDVWHKWKPYSEYRKHFFRYLSEFGFESFPCEKTVETFTLPEDRNIFSPVMDCHQRRPGGNGKIMGYLADTFLYPADFSTQLYASQLLQATAIRYCVEHLRRNRGRCMGALYWQLNDVWPVASWASIDYFGRWKALHYAAKRFFAPVLLSCEERGETQAQELAGHPVYPGDYETTALLAVQNETHSEVRGKVRWALRRPDSAILAQGETNVTVPPFSAAALPEMDFRQTDARKNHLSFELETAEGIVSAGSALFTAPKYYAFRDPHLTFERHGDELTIHADAYAMFVEIDSPDSDFLVSDNYFDMERGSRTVKILEGEPKTIRLRSVYDIR